MAKKRHVIGNWKMHGSKEHVETFFGIIQSHEDNSFLTHIEAVVCPPAVYLGQAASCLMNLPALKLGAQDVSEHAIGPYTGEIAATMLAELGCRYVIVGHSERRQYAQESDETVAQKFFAAKAAGLIPILCVGETQAQRLEMLTERVVLEQIEAILAIEGITSFDKALLAYEPIWAIGTGLTASPEQAQAVHHLLRRTLAAYDATVAERLPILYGGSVKASNAKALFEMPDIDGALVGGASLQALEFMAICKAAF